MVEFSLPANSKPVKGKTYKAQNVSKSSQLKNFQIYRYNPDEP